MKRSAHMVLGCGMRGTMGLVLAFNPMINREMKEKMQEKYAR